jgi:hypothetical protein
MNDPNIELFLHYQEELVSSYGLHVPDQLQEVQEPEQFNERTTCHQTTEFRNNPVLMKN